MSARNALFVFNLARLSLFQISFGILLGLLNDTLNRVMKVELGLSATLVFTLINLKELLAVLGVKVWAGNASDNTELFGYRRTPFMLAGLVMACVPFFFITPAAFEVPTDGLSGILKLILAFTLFGVGLHIALTAYYGLIVDFAGEKHLGKMASISWCLLVLAGIITAVLTGKALDTGFSEARLHGIAQTAGIVAFLFGIFSTVGIETRKGEKSEKSVETSPVRESEALSFGQSLKLISASPQTQSFAFYIFISIFAAFGNELVMEPFGGDVFGLSVAETSKFKPLLGGAQLIFMLLTGFTINYVGKKNYILLGNSVCTVGFILLIASGVMQSQPVLNTALVVIGVGLGMCTIGNITLMMTMNAGRGGLFMGLWGTAQSAAMFVGGTGVGALLDGITSLTGNTLLGYTAIFGLEILAFTVSTVMLPAISSESFEEETKVKLEEVLAVAAD